MPRHLRPTTRTSAGVLILVAPDPRLESANEALLDRLRAGDPDALARLYDDYADLAHGLAQRILREAPEAEEVTQDVFLYVWRNAARFDRSRGTLGTWIATLARSRAIDRLRTRHSRTRRAQELWQEHAAAPSISSSDPLAELERKERGVRVRRALAALPDEQRRALEIAYFEGLSYRDVAARIETPVGTVKTRIRQGMMRLRVALERGELPERRAAERRDAAGAP